MDYATKKNMVSRYKKIINEVLDPNFKYIAI